MNDKLKAAYGRYWAAETPAQERAAYAEIRALGGEAAYDEDDRDFAEQKKMEHPGDWIMREKDFAQWCSAFGYRLLTLADRAADKMPSKSETKALHKLDKGIRALGG